MIGVETEEQDRAYNHDRNLSKGVHVRDPRVFFVLPLLHVDRDKFVRDVQFFADDEDRN